jgi:hypothetical protein
VRTYAVLPRGAKLQANVKLVELNDREKAAKIRDEENRYEGFPYTPLTGPSRRQNCAGFVLQKLFGPKMVDANVDPEKFYDRVVVPFGSERVARATSRPGDVVVYKGEDGTVNHVAIVESKPSAFAPPTILTKDGDERLYRARFPGTPLRATNDPLVTQHAGRGKGSVEFWRVDKSKVDIKQIATTCD